MERKEVLSQFHRNKIIEAAYHLFLENDWEKVTVDEIAKKSGVSKATVYAYFESKHEIFNFIILKCFAIQKEYIEKVNVLQQPFKEKYYEFCNAIIDFEKTYPKCFQATLLPVDLAIDDTPENILSQIHLVGEEIVQIIENHISRAVDCGEISLKQPVKPTALFLSFSINGLIQITRSKERYIQTSTGYTRAEFLAFSFDHIYKEILE